MKTFRRIIFWLHLASGVLAGIFIFIMCVTGALLAFEPNVLEWVESDQRNVTAPTGNTPKLSVSGIITKVLETKPDAKPANLVIQNDKTSAAAVSVGRAGQVFVDPYTGAITGEGAASVRAAFRFVEDLHRWIAFPGEGRAIGKAISGACNLMFLFLALSGIYIWFPRRLSWRHFRASIALKWKVKGKARDFNWHTVLGFWTSAILIVLTITAAMISYQWFGNLAYVLTGNEIPPPPGQNRQSEEPYAIPENMDAIFAKAENHTAWKTITLRLPAAKDAVALTIDEGIYWNVFGRSNLTIDAKTAEVTKWEPYGGQNSARQIRSWARFTHTGESFGIIGQIVGFLACIGGAVLVWTGFSLAWRRFRHWRAKKLS